jgi:hypothetical protein
LLAGNQIVLHSEIVEFVALLTVNPLGSEIEIKVAVTLRKDTSTNSIFGYEKI